MRQQSGSNVAYAQIATWVLTQPFTHLLLLIAEKSIMREQTGSNVAHVQFISGH
jgi:hypothetical protein